MNNGRNCINMLDLHYSGLYS